MKSPVTVHSQVVSSDACGQPFRNLPNHLLHLIASVSSTASYRRKTKLFVESQMREHHDFAIAVAQQLSANYYSLHDAVRSLGLATHPVERLAKLLLSWTSIGNEDISRRDDSFKLPLTHQEIADSIGSTRETVSKLFSELRRKHLLRSEGGALTIMNRLELQRIVRF